MTNSEFDQEMNQEADSFSEDFTADSPASEFSGAGAAPAQDHECEGGQSLHEEASEELHLGESETVQANGEEESAELSDPLSEAMDTISRLEDQLARRNADVYNLEQEYNGYVRRSKAEAVNIREAGVVAVVEALLPVLDDVELARQHGDLQGTFQTIAEKLEAALLTGFAVERFGAVGDPFDPQVHEALMHNTSPDVDSEQVGTLIQPGYRVGERVLRAARVGVVSPE